MSIELLPAVRRGPTYFARTTTPIGTVLLLGEDDGVTGLYLEIGRHARSRAANCLPDDGRLGEASRQVDEYFAGTRKEFDLRLQPRGTPFQLAVWEALLGVPYGTTNSYGAIARVIGDPTAARAVGTANGQNPISIIIPCHRIIGSTGALIGYGWGLERKKWLLGHEQGEIRLPV